MQNADVDWMSSPSIFVDDFHAVSRPTAPHLATVGNYTLGFWWGSRPLGWALERLAQPFGDLLDESGNI